MSRLPSLSGADNLKQYLSQAVLPSMTHGSSAPSMPPPGHKAHRNHIAIRPERYRKRFVRIVNPKSTGTFDSAVLNFVRHLPCKPLDQPNVEESTGFAFSVPARGFNIGQSPLPYPSSVQEIALWVMALPLQTMTRAIHAAFPGTHDWDVTYASSEDTDLTIWNTLVWRKIPLTDPEKPWVQVDPLNECSVVFVVQPPWVMTPHDFQSFMRCSSLPPFRRPGNNRPFTSAERVWAKLWDTCVRKQCHHWVISSYAGWVFGAFSEGYTAGQIVGYKTHDASEPTILECLVYHVATSMGLINVSKLPQYQETTRDLRWNMDIPPASRIEDVDFPDSGSDWDGMDQEPGISAGVSTSGSVILSGWGSESEYCPPSTMPSQIRRVPSLSPSQCLRVQGWQDSVGDEPPPYERESSPALSETALSTAAIYSAASRSGNALPNVKVVSREDTRGFGTFLTTIVEQGPVEIDEEL